MVGRWILTSLGTSLVVLNSAVGQQLDWGVIHEPIHVNSHPEESRIRRELDRFHSLDFVEVPLSEVARYFSREGVPLSVDVRALDDYGIRQDTPVTFQRRQVRLRDALNLILRPLDLEWTIYDGSLLITTSEEAESLLVTKIYDVRNLVGRDADFDSLINVVTITIAPQTWEDVGGLGSIQEYETPRIRALVISQDYQIHEQIELLLNHLGTLGGFAPLHASTSVATSSWQPVPPPTSWKRTPTSHTNIHSSRLRMTGR